MSTNQLVHSVHVVFDRWWDICGPYMCPKSPVTWTSTLLGMPTWPAVSFSLCCFWQVVSCHTDLHSDRNVYLTSWFILSVWRLWSLHVSQIPLNTDFHPCRNCYQPAGSFCPCCFWQVVGSLWSLHVSGIPCQMDLHPGRNVYLNSFFCFWQAVRHLWSLHMFRIPFYTDLHPGRNVYLSSWLILSVLFLTGGETSVFPTCVLTLMACWFYLSLCHVLKCHILQQSGFWLLVEWRLPQLPLLATLSVSYSESHRVASCLKQFYGQKCTGSQKASHLFPVKEAYSKAYLHIV